MSVRYQRIRSGNVLHPSRLRNHTLRTGEMSVECWCRRKVVYATPDEIMRGVTRSCGDEGCDETALEGMTGGQVH